MIITVIFIASICKIPLPSVFAANTTVTYIYVDKARYKPGDIVTITADVDNYSSSDFSGDIYLKIYHNEKLIYTTTDLLSLSAGETGTKYFTWTAPTEDYQGYMVHIFTTENDIQTAAIDVSSDITRFPRYGYIQNFDEDISDNSIDNQIDTLIQDYYMNSFQFYDWMWRHEVPIERTDGVNVDTSWLDLFDRTISWDTLLGYIDAVQDKNAAAMAYMMSYAAREGYTDYSVLPSWGIFTDTSHQSQLNVDFNNGRYLWLFAPTNSSWQNYIASAYADAINTAGFDGIQMDQMGQRSNVYDYNGNSYDLENSFSSLINEIKDTLVNNNSNKSYLDFNIVDGTVDGWALEDVSANANTDFNFSEIWWLSDNYNDIRNYVEQLRSLSIGKAAVLAAYMNYNDNYGTSYEAEDAVYSGVDVETNHTGYSGSGFLQNFAQEGDYVEFSITAEESMTYALVFQYGDNSDEATGTLYVDGNGIGQVQFHPQATWDTFVYDAYINTYLTAGTHTVRIAYDSDDTGAINLDSLTLGEFEESSIRLADAAIAASGATHIELGAGLDDVTMLGSEYYPNTSKVMSGTLKDAMKDYYKFITAYENLLFDPDITYTDQGNQSIQINGQSISGDGTQETIWHIARMTEEYDVLHLINLTSETDSLWRNTSTTPSDLTDLSVTYYLSPDAEISGIYLASPDYDEGASTELSYVTGSDETGSHVTFTIPSLKYWDMVYIARMITDPEDDLYEAEKGIKTNVSVNTDHTGYTGDGFVDAFADEGDEVTFQIHAATEDTYYLDFKYANNTGYTATRHIYVDGTDAGILSMQNLGSWDTWDTASMSVNLKKGIHTVCIYYDSTDNHAINLDSLSLRDN